ncbi:MAG: hypothetical protein MUC38_01540 [Cyclobacteriaceae bacterium]|jgi:hypothetical protein|nr:hypothetical protein [Cyclobacteriaceae bacterium]
MKWVAIFWLFFLPLNLLQAPVAEGKEEKVELVAQSRAHESEKRVTASQRISAAPSPLSFISVASRVAFQTRTTAVVASLFLRIRVLRI